VTRATVAYDRCRELVAIQVHVPWQHLAIPEGGAPMQAPWISVRRPDPDNVVAKRMGDECGGCVEIRLRIGADPGEAREVEQRQSLSAIGLEALNHFEARHRGLRTLDHRGEVLRDDIQILQALAAVPAWHPMGPHVHHAKHSVPAPESYD